MPLTQFCKKCKADVRPGDLCPRCGTRLPKTAERLVITVTRYPVRDWFAWNAMLRILLPVLGLVLLVTLGVEGWARGAAGVQAVFMQGFFWSLMGLLGVTLCVTFGLFFLQGPEQVRYILDARGAHAIVFIPANRPLRVYARLLTPQAALALQEDAGETPPEGMLLVRKTDVAWNAVRRVRFWPETGTVLFFRPNYWQALTLRCDQAAYAEAEAFVRKRLARNRKALGEQTTRQKV
jgi:hypothetical protein